VKPPHPDLPAPKARRPWPCPRCGQVLRSSWGKGNHVRKHVRESVCEVGIGCLRAPAEMTSDGRTCCYPCMSTLPGKKPPYGQRTTPYERDRRGRRRAAKKDA
jgi:hypothetical protein